MGTSQEDLVRQIETLLRQTSFLVKKRGREILADFSMTIPQLHALLVVRDNPSITMGALCERLYLACSTATDLVDRLEKNGFLERTKDFNDRRVVRLQITDKGLDVINKVIEARRRYVSSILTSLTQKEKEQLVSSLGKLHSLMLNEVVN